jgi:FAD/FMN-containing dehydrogenase
MFPTLGGCLAANIHGKNNWVAGPLGEHVLEFEALLPNGSQVTCSPEKHSDLFYSMIGGMGLLGTFTSITLKMKQIASGNMEVLAWAEPTLAGMLEAVDGNKGADYIVGWVDCTVGGGAIGRGQVHRARYLKPGEETDPDRSLRIDAQTLSDRMFGVFPKAWMPPFMALATNNPGVRVVNAGKYWLSRTLSHQHRYRQSLVAFNFLLDYVPGWERMYGRGGLIQYQSFLPKAAAQEAYAEMLRLCQQRKQPSYLGVLKRHRPDKFLLSHAVDGFSLALDFRVTTGNRERLRALTAELDEIALKAGGRFYFAKDSTLNAEKARRYLGSETIEKFRQLKAQADPGGLLETDLWRRCFG